MTLVRHCCAPYISVSVGVPMADEISDPWPRLAPCATQLDSVGDITMCTFSGNTAVSGQAVYSFDSVSTLSTNGYENEPFNALFLDQSLGFDAATLVAG